MQFNQIYRKADLVPLTGYLVENVSSFLLHDNGKDVAAVKNLDVDWFSSTRNWDRWSPLVDSLLKHDISGRTDDWQVQPDSTVEDH